MPAGVLVERELRGLAQPLHVDDVERRRAPGEGDRVPWPRRYRVERRRRSSAAISATSVGVWPTRTPRASSASCFAFAVPGRAGDDRARVAHRLAGRRREAGDVGDHRLGDVLGDVLGGLLLGRAADLARHHDQLGLRVGLERGDHVDEARARDRVAADADDARVAEAALGQLVADLVGQRARARDDADVALLEERGRDDPDVRLARREDAGAVRADEADVVGLRARWL